MNSDGKLLRMRGGLPREPALEYGFKPQKVEKRVGSEKTGGLGKERRRGSVLQTRLLKKGGSQIVSSIHQWKRSDRVGKVVTSRKR